VVVTSTSIESEGYQTVAMEVKIQTLTPIWTGGIEAGKCDRIHETGLLGSLRWWMEVLVRGMGGVVCDPTAEKSQDRSSLDTEKFHAKKYRELQNEVERRKYLRDAGLCDVSQIFGATGWKRQFRLEVEEKNTSTIQIEDKYAKSRSLTAIKGKFTIKIQGLNPTFDPQIIGGLIQFIADYSTLGARPRMGFGVIKIEGDRIPMQPLYNWLIGTSGYKKYENLPSLNNILMAKIQPKNLSFDDKGIKHDLRQLLRTNEDKPEVKSSKPILKKDKKKNQLAEEKNSVPRNQKDAQVFLRSLLGLSEDM
jgi:CRISPR-associated protein Cmr1